VIRLSDIRYRYPKTGWVLKSVGLSVDQGEYLLIGGGNGSGKSTLGYIFNGLIPHHFGGILQGTVRVAGLNTLEHKVSDLFSQVGLVLQNADAQLFNSTVEDEIAFGLESLGVPGSEIAERIREISITLGLEDLLSRSPMTLSGGEKRLVAIASEPRCSVLTHLSSSLMNLTATSIGPPAKKFAKPSWRSIILARQS